ncbi:MAG: HEAT repeat domain-containing protein [Methanobrevibacter sp.]|nr:HEAT repeat domain-containing protein [Methanobrevibacter sp.]
MKLDSRKKIKSKLIEIYNEELLHLNLFIKDPSEIKENKDLIYLFSNRLSKEFNDIDDEVFEGISLYKTVPTFYRRAYQFIAREYLNSREIDNLNEDDVLAIDDDSSLIEIAYNHREPEIRSLALSKIEKPPILLDFIFNDKEEYVRLDALYYLFGEDFMDDLMDIDYFCEIPKEIIFDFDYDKISQDFGIDEPLFKKYDRLIISEVSFEDGLIVHTDPENSYEHAVSKITNQDALKEILNTHPRWSARYIAANKINDLDYLQEIVINGLNSENKPKHGILYYPGEISERDIYESLFHRMISLMDLSGEDLDNFLIRLFYKSKDSMMQSLCLSKIENDDFLMYIGDREANPHFADVILDQINDDVSLILFSISILKNPRFSGNNVRLMEEIFNSDLDEETFKRLEKQSRFDEIDYRNVRANACRKLVSLPSETLNKTLADICSSDESLDDSSPKFDVDYLRESKYFKDIMDEKITDILLEIARTDEAPLVRSIAVSGVKDISGLGHLALDEKDDEVACNTIKRIDDEDFIEYYLLKCGRNPYYLLKNDLVKNQSILADIAKNDSWGPTRKEAVRNIADEELLEHIARNDEDPFVRREAILKIKNQDILIDAAYNDSDSLTKDFAISRIDDEEVLTDLLYKNDDSNILRTIFSKINNQEILKDFAYNHQNPDVRYYAASNIEDNRILVDIAKNDEKWVVRRNCIGYLVKKSIGIKEKRYINDRYMEHIEKRKYFNSLLINDNGCNYLSDLSRNSSRKNDDSLSLSDGNLNSTYHDDGNDKYVDESSIVLFEDEKPYTLKDLLVDRAYNDLSEEIRKFAVSYISDENLLFDIVNNEKSTDVRLAALDGVERNGLLAEIFVKSKNHHVYRKAISKIRYEYILLKLANLKSFYGELWHKDEIAKHRLRQLGFNVPIETPKYDGKNIFHRPIINSEDFNDMLNEIDRLEKLLKDSDDSSNFDESSDSDGSDDLDESNGSDGSDFPFKRIVF